MVYLAWKTVKLADGSGQKMEIWEVGEVQYGRMRKMKERYEYVYMWYINEGGEWELMESTENPYYRPVDVEEDDEK